MLNDVCPKSPPLGGTIIMKWKALHSMEHRQRIEAKPSPCLRQRIFPRGGKGEQCCPEGEDNRVTASAESLAVLIIRKKTSHLLLLLHLTEEL
ncbi:hypothetical protein CDAR_507521 [Caerostris darwini]|uniref:Uncharacterized protein n=1 Tax=Caerostris darwini TaxID=1538125 RepID=A0AAV4MW00_9ARAC|nr:hypothetical protein CDAR_507521 [Caerostris darwini]